jgi:hypothetical protein
MKKSSELKAKKRVKTVSSLLKELQAFEKEGLGDIEVRISFDGGETHKPISILHNRNCKYAIIVNSEVKEMEI